MTEFGNVIMQSATTLFLAIIAARGIIRTLNSKSNWYEGFLAAGSIMSLVWVLNV